MFFFVIMMFPLSLSVSSSRSPSMENELLIPIESIMNSINQSMSPSIANLRQPPRLHTAYGSKEERKEMRKMRNRQSAKESRERKKDYQDVLENTVRTLYKDNLALKEKEEKMKEEVETLREERNGLHELIGRLISQSADTADSAPVLSNLFTMTPKQEPTTLLVKQEIE